MQIAYLRAMQQEQILANLKIKALNEMQVAMQAAAGEHANIMLLSATGSGKTLAFLLPMLRHIDASLRATQALIIAPSRELALQIERVFKQMGTGVSITCCYGGHKREIEENNLIETVGSSRVDLQACKLEYSIVSPK